MEPRANDSFTGHVDTEQRDLRGHRHPTEKTSKTRVLTRPIRSSTLTRSVVYGCLSKGFTSTGATLKVQGIKTQLIY